MRLACLVVLAACSGRGPVSPRPADEATLAATDWHAYSDRDPAPACANPNDCGDGHFLFGPIGASAGATAVTRVARSAHGYIIYYSGVHPCGAPMVGPHWQVALPLPVAPVEVHDEVPSPNCRDAP